MFRDISAEKKPFKFNQFIYNSCLQVIVLTRKGDIRTSKRTHTHTYTYTHIQIVKLAKKIIKFSSKISKVIRELPLINYVKTLN